MKLKRYTPEYLKYWHNKEEIDIPEYQYKEENVRGCWISNVMNIDTPKCTDVEAYKKHLVGILDNMQSYNMNLAVFQVRPCNDAYYPSKLNPWSRFVTGTEGKDPGFDVLGFFIEEAKKRNIKVHAWMNPYRVSTVDIRNLNMTKEEFLDTLSENNWARLNKEHTILDGVHKIILSPSHPEVIDFVTRSIMEVAENYDVEGVHIDDYFYPYAKIPEELEYDDYLKYRDSIDQSFDDFRRANVDKMIKSISDALKKLLSKNGKKVEFGISPFAVYRTNSSIVEGGWEKGSYNAASALQCYTELYSDVYKWMVEGWIDYVVPQNYFSFERRDVAYHDVAWWWSNICKETKTTLYMGQGIYHMGAKEGWGAETWQNPDEIHNQICFNCNFENIEGTIFFTYKDLVPGQNPIKDACLEKLKKTWNNK
jgi:uncharacterized lipoprotein YddW (UPF0748 family)